MSGLELCLESRFTVSVWKLSFRWSDRWQHSAADWSILARTSVVAQYRIIALLAIPASTELIAASLVGAARQPIM